MTEPWAGLFGSTLSPLPTPGKGKCGARKPGGFLAPRPAKGLAPLGTPLSSLHRRPAYCCKLDVGGGGEDNRRTAAERAVLQSVGGAGGSAVDYLEHILAAITRDIRPGKLRKLVKFTGWGKVCRVRPIRPDFPESVLAGIHRCVTHGEAGQLVEMAGRAAWDVVLLWVPLALACKSGTAMTNRHTRQTARTGVRTRKKRVVYIGFSFRTQAPHTRGWFDTLHGYRYVTVSNCL